MPLNRPASSTGQSAPHDPALDTFITALEAAAAETIEECRAASAAFLETFVQAVSSLTESLDKSRAQLADSFAQVREKTPENIPEAAERLQTELDAQRSWLQKKVRPQFEQQMKSWAPDKKPVLGLLEKMAESARAAADALPDQQQPQVNAPAPMKKNLLQRLNRGLRQFSGLDDPASSTPRSRACQALPSSEALQMNPLVVEYAEFITQIESKTADIWASLRFHFQVAREELDLLQTATDKTVDFAKVIDETEHLAVGILASAAEQISAQAQPMQEFWSALCDRLQQHENCFCQSLCDTFAAQENGTEGWLEIRRTLRQQSDRVRQRLLDSQGGKGPLNLISLSKAMLGGLQAVIPKETGQQEKLLRLADLPSTTEILKRSDNFPHLYRRLFTLGPLKNREFLVARDEELKTLDDLYKRWENGKSCSLAVIGPEGSGKTSLANCFASEYGARGNLLRFEITQRLRTEQEVIALFHQWFAIEEPTETLDALVQQLRSRPRGMLLIEGGHNLFLRVVGGGRAAEVFFYLVLATRQHFLWQITFRKIPWTRMDYQFGISRFFTHQLPTLLADQQEIRQALMLRQRISGYPLDFLGNDNETAETTREELNKREERFFRELFAASGGNLDAALYYWLLCLTYDPEKQRFAACHLGKIDFSFLRSLDRDQLFTLAEVLGHGGLSACEHSKIFHCDLLHSRLQLDFLSSLGLLLAASSSDNDEPIPYRLNPVYYTPVTSTLEAMHIIH